MQDAMQHHTGAKAPVSVSDRNSRVYIQLRNLILDGKYNPDEPFNIGDLADALRVSATPVREALVRLSAEEITILVPHRGFFVKQLHANEIIYDYELAFLVLTHALEKNLGAFSDEGLHIPANAIIIDDLVFAPGGEERAARTLSAFIGELLGRIAEISGNERIAAIVHRFVERTERFRERELLQPHNIDLATHSIRSLLEAARNGDVAALLECLKDQFRMEIDGIPTSSRTNGVRANFLEVATSTG